jgi:hypothetical protein
MAPLLLTSLGLPVPAELEGQVPEGALASMALAARVEQTAAVPARSTTAHKPPAGPLLDAEAEAEILKRLRALGYVE